MCVSLSLSVCVSLSHILFVSLSLSFSLSLILSVSVSHSLCLSLPLSLSLSFFLSVCLSVSFYFCLPRSLISSSLKGNDDEDDDGSHHDVPVSKGIGYLILGGVLIIAFSGMFIEAVVELAYSLEVSSIMLAFFLAPIASEAPEILESISLSRKGHSQSINIAFSNLIGGTLSKTTLLCGVRQRNREAERQRE